MSWAGCPPAHDVLGCAMRSDYSSADRRKADDDEAGRPIRGSAFGLLLGITGGFVLLVVAAGGAYYLGTLRSAPPPAPARTQAQAPAQPAGPPPIQWTTVGRFGSWEARCTNNPPNGAAKLCTALLQVMDNRTKKVLVAWIVGPDDKGALQTVLQTPTGVMVSAGVEVKLGKAAARKINYQSCGAQQCVAIAPMNDAFVKEVVAADKADLTLTALNGRTLNFGIPVNGLDKALDAIKK